MPGEKLRYPGRNYLFAPGPTHIPVVVQNAMNTPMETIEHQIFLVW